MILELADIFLFSFNFKVGMATVIVRSSPNTLLSLKVIITEFLDPSVKQ